eukprot:4540335-Prymnesium_polylepis.1
MSMSMSHVHVHVRVHVHVHVRVHVHIHVCDDPMWCPFDTSSHLDAYHAVPPPAARPRLVARWVTASSGGCSWST